VTAQSFIENKYGGGVFLGDNRGFTDSPADGITDTFRTEASAAWNSPTTGIAGSRAECSGAGQGCFGHGAEELFLESEPVSIDSSANGGIEWLAQ